MRNVHSPRRSVLLLLQMFALCVPLVRAQDVDKRAVIDAFVAAQQRFYDKQSYALDMRITTYMGHDAVQPVDSASALFVRDGSAYYGHMLDVTYVQDDKLRLVITSDNGPIMLADPIPVPDPMEFLDPVRLMDQVLEVHSTPVARGIRYSMMTAHPQYERIEHVIDEKGWIIELALFHRDALPDGEGDRVQWHKPKIVVRMTPPRPLDRKKDRERLDLSRYVILKEGTPTSALPGREVFDSRVR